MASRRQVIVTNESIQQQQQQRQQRQQPQQHLSNEVSVPTPIQNLGPSSQANNTTKTIVQALQPSGTPFLESYTILALSYQAHNHQPPTTNTPPENSAGPATPPPGFSSTSEAPPPNS